METRIKQIIKNKGLTIAFVANKIGMTPYSLGQNLSGKISMKLCTLYKISEVLGISWTDYETNK